MPRSSTIIFDTIAIAGVGLIGGSLGMAAKKLGLARRVIGLGRSESRLMKAQILGAVDEYTLDFASGASEADLVVICTPVQTVVPVIRQMAGSLKPGAIITDVGSTKAEIVRQAGAITPDGCSFIGGHPMAGSEQAGVEAAYPDLFLGATYVLTPSEECSLADLGKMTELAEAIGSDVQVMDPERHDAAVAIISHLPHAIAASLLRVAETAQRSGGKAFSLAAGSFRDLTRISDSPPELWRDICSTNTESIVAALDSLEQQLREFRQALTARDEDAIERFFEDARQIRQTYLRRTK